MPIRISSNYLSQILVNDLNNSLGNMLDLQVQAGTMQRINDWADDPRGVGAMQRYDTLIANNTQYLRNLNRSRVIIDSTDTALQDVSSILSSVREVVLRETSALGTDSTRVTAMTEVDNLTNRLLDVLNTTVEGNYIFSGTASDTVPFVLNGDTVIYQGNSEVYSAQVGPDSDQILNITGDVFMGSRSATISGGVSLAPRLDGTTALDDLNLGGGWEPGSIEIRDGNGDVYTVGLNGSSTVDDLIAAVAADTGGAVTMSILPDGTGLQLDGVGPLTVTEVNDGGTASSLGIQGDSDGSIFSGRDIRTAISDTTPLANIPTLDGSLPLGTIEVEVNGVVTSVDLSGAATLGDLKSDFEAAMPGFELRLDASGVSVVSGSTAAFEIRNSGTPSTATLLGIEGTGTPVRTFGVLEDLKDALEANDVDAIRATMVELEELENMIQSQIITVGGRQGDVDWTENLLMQRDTQLRAKLSLERDADVAAVSAGLAQAEVSYQSSLLVTSKLFQSNLMMYL